MVLQGDICKKATTTASIPTLEANFFQFKMFLYSFICFDFMFKRHFWVKVWVGIYTKSWNTILMQEKLILIDFHFLNSKHPIPWDVHQFWGNLGLITSDWISNKRKEKWRAYEGVILIHQISKASKPKPAKSNSANGV